MWAETAQKLEELFAANRKNGFSNIELGVAASDETIAGIEKILRIRLPDDYLQFLRELGGIGIGDSYFFGTWSNTLEDCRGTTVLGETLRLREEFGMPHDLVAVFGSDYESYLCLNCSTIDTFPKLAYFSVSQNAVYPCEHSISFVDFLDKYVDALLGKAIAAPAQRKPKSLFEQIVAKLR